MISHYSLKMCCISHKNNSPAYPKNALYCWVKKAMLHILCTRIHHLEPCFLNFLPVIPTQPITAWTPPLSQPGYGPAAKPPICVRGHVGKHGSGEWECMRTEDVSGQNKDNNDKAGQSRTNIQLCSASQQAVTSHL